jgi:class 3 adenylate cyclase
MAAHGITAVDIFRDREKKGALHGYIARTLFFLGLLLIYIRHETTLFHTALCAALFGIPVLIACASVFLHLRKIKRQILPVISIITDNAFLAGFALFSVFVSRSVTGSEAWSFDIPYTVIAVILITLTLLTFIPLFPTASGISAALIYACAIVMVRAVLIPADTARPSLLPAIAVFPACMIIAGAIPSAVIYAIRTDAARLFRMNTTLANLARSFTPRTARRINREGYEFALTKTTEAVNAAVMSVGIRSFPLLCEKHNPNVILSLLSSYYSHVPAVILEHGGTIHSFCGDEIVASFGTPNPTADNPSEAVLTSTAIAESISIINETSAENDLPEIQISIGIHYGAVAAGVIGTEERMEYSLAGSALTVARKLREACSVIDRNILVSKGLVEILREDFRFSKNGSTVIKDTGATIDFYSPADE